jgi:hypothetical protein
MTDKQAQAADTQNPDPSQFEVAHSIIESLLDHTRVVSDLIALMAQALDEDAQKALTLTSQWQAYLESRRHLERTREDIERFVKLVTPHAKD